MAADVPTRPVPAARAVAEALLRDLPERWRHTSGVAGRVEDFLDTVEDPDRDVLRAAAWLHDIGYSPLTRDTGFHPLDGARYLSAHGWPRRLCGLVAHHSASRFVAEGLGLADELDRYEREESPVADALLYADQTVGPNGQPMTIAERTAEKVARHGPGTVQARVHGRRTPDILMAVARVDLRLHGHLGTGGPAEKTQ